MNELAIKIGIKMGMFDADLKKASLEIRQFEQTTKSIASTIGRYAGALGIATTAIEVFNIAANANRDTLIELLSTLKGLESSVKDFFTAILTGDWAVFENGILNAIGLAKLYLKQLILAELASQMGKTKAERYEGQRNNYEYLITSEHTSKAEKLDAYDKYAELTEAEIRERQHTNMYLWNSIATALEAQNIKSIKTVELLLDAIDKYLDPKTLEYGSLEFYKLVLKNLKDERRKAGKLSPDGMTYTYDPEELQILELTELLFDRPHYDELIRLLNLMRDEENKVLLETLDQINDNIDKIGTAKKDLDDAKADLEKALNTNTNTVIKGATGSNIPVGSLAWYDKLISAKKTELSLAISDLDRIRINKELEELTEKRRVIEFHYKYPTAPNGKLSDRTSLALSMPDMKGYKIEKKDSPIKQYTADNYDYIESLNAITNVMGVMANMTNEGASAWLTWSASLMSATATAVEAIRLVVTAKTAEAAASGAAEAAKTPFVGWLMVGAAIASIMAAFAALPSFSTGGIFAGNSTIGDMNLARVNAGEMILNNRQQRNLFNLLNSNGTLGNSGNGLVTFKIQGKELVGVLNNYNNQKSKVR